MHEKPHNLKTAVQKHLDIRKLVKFHKVGYIFEKLNFRKMIGPFLQMLFVFKCNFLFDYYQITAD